MTDLKPVLFFLIFILFSLGTEGQTGKLTGHITVKTSGDTAIVREHLMVWLKTNEGKWCITGLDKNFNFDYDNLKADTTEIRLTTIDRYKDTIVNNIIIRKNETTHIEIPYPPFCEYDKIKNDSICPICNKQDQVNRIVYERYPDPPKGRKRRNKYWAEHSFTTGCDPHWYCRRDDRKF